MPDSEFIELSYDQIIEAFLKQQTQLDIEETAKEYFDARYIGLELSTGRHLVRLRGGTVTAISVTNTSFRIGEVVSMFLPAAAGVGYISKKPR